MRVTLFLFILICLFSCNNIKENINSVEINNEIVKNDSIVDSLLVIDLDKDDDGVLDINDDCPELFGTNELGCPEDNHLIVENNEQIRKNIDERGIIKQIEKHERKTNLKVVDATSKLKENDTTSGWIAYSVPEEMKVAKTYSIKVRISKKSTSQTKAHLILGSSDAINNPSLPSVATI
jgi:hypothetical protein